MIPGRIALDADGTPVEVNEMTTDSSAYILCYEFERHPERHTKRFRRLPPRRTLS